MSQDNNEERRQRPVRENRGVRREHNAEQDAEDNQIYQQIFGNIDESDSQDQSFSQQIGLRPLQTSTANFANYNYGRGYHYFFDLDRFPRVQGSPSYALDAQNCFKYTYSQDHVLIKQTPISKIINRTYIGLPTIQTTIGNTKNLDKNVCHYHLFETQDQKYQNNRLISKYRYILNHLQALTQQNKLRKYTELKKDVVMHQVWEKDVPLQRKKQILENRIKILVHRVNNMKNHWEWKDRIYFRFSQNQLFHNQALIKGRKLYQRTLKQRIFIRVLSIKQQIECPEQIVILGAERPKGFVQKWVRLELQEKKVLSQEMINRLANSPKLIEMLRIKQQLIIFPRFMFHLGDSSKAVDALMKAHLQSDYNSEFYVYKAFIKKLFKRDLNCQQQHLQQPILTEQYREIMKEKLNLVEDFYQNSEDAPKRDNKKTLLIDQLIQISAIEKTPLTQTVHLLPSQNKIQITLKQLMLLYCYRNISRALEAFIDYINRDPQILKLMADYNYEKFHYGIARHIDSHQFCILINDITRFTNLLANTSLLTVDFDQTLFFSHDKKSNLAYLWVESQTQDWQTEKEDQDENNEDQDNNEFARNVFNDDYDPQPIKKIKRNESQQ